MSFRAKCALAWTVLILAACWSPNFVWESASRSAGGFSWGKLHLDKFVHVALFAGMSYLWVGIGSDPRRVYWVVAGGLLLAVVSELGQAVLPIDRSADLIDTLADAFGVFLGILVYQRVSARNAVR